MIKSYFFILIFAGFTGDLQALTIKLGTLAPANSSWHNQLVILSSKWEKISKGEVKIKVFPGGIAGNGEDMIRKMRIGQLQATAMSISETSRIYSGIKALSWPRLIRTTDEAIFVLKENVHFFNQEMEKRGYIAPVYSFLGWAHLFSREPVENNSALMDIKLHVSNAHNEEIRAWQKSGFNVVPLPTMEIMTALQFSMIDTYIASPSAAMVFQWFALTPHMNSMNYAPIFGILLISKNTWNKIPEEYHAPFLDAAQKIAKELSSNSQDIDQAATKTMIAMGMNIHTSSSEMEQEWEQILQQCFIPTLIKKNKNNLAAYELIQESLEYYRNNTQ